MKPDLAQLRRAGLTALSLAALTLPLAVPAHAAAHAEGEVRSIALGTGVGAVGTLTLDTRLGPVTFIVNAATQIEVADHTAALTELLAGYEAEVEYTVKASALVATKIEAEPPHEEVFGLVTGCVKGAGNVVEVTIDSPTGDPTTVKVDGQTDVALGQDGDADLASMSADQLAALKGNFYANVDYVIGISLATELVFRPARRIPFKGILESEDAASHSISIELADGDELPLINVQASTSCRLNGKVVSWDALTPGDRCEGTFYMAVNSAGTASNVTVSIKAQTPRPVEFSGTISAITTAPASGGTSGSGTVELTLRNGSKVTVAVNSSTQIKINGKPAAFADLAVNQETQVTCTPRPDGQNADGTDKTRYDCSRIQAKKPRPTGQSGR